MLVPSNVSNIQNPTSFIDWFLLYKVRSCGQRGQNECIEYGRSKMLMTKIVFLHHINKTNQNAHIILVIYQVYDLLLNALNSRPCISFIKDIQKINTFMLCSHYIARKNCVFLWQTFVFYSKRYINIILIVFSRNTLYANSKLTGPFQKIFIEKQAI